MATEVPIPDEPASPKDVAPEAPTTLSRRRRILRWTIRALATLLITWFVLAYVVLPMVWRHYEHNPALQNAPKTTTTPQGIPGDPLNVGLIGTEEEIVGAMLEAGWDPADPVTLRSSFRIAKSVLFDRPYTEAPISPLYLFGRKQDLAFQQAVGDSARKRHHVRFWRSVELGRKDAPLWIGSVTYDNSVGLSRRTGQITHHIAPDIDAERDLLINELRKKNELIELYQVTGVGATLNGRNGGGDRYYTDGELTIGMLAADATEKGEPARLANPVAVQIKEQLWTAIRPILQALPVTEVSGK
jgi:LssY C-terminus